MLRTFHSLPKCHCHQSGRLKLGPALTAPGTPRASARVRRSPVDSHTARAGPGHVQRCGCQRHEDLGWPGLGTGPGTPPGENRDGRGPCGGWQGRAPRCGGTVACSIFLGPRREGNVCRPRTGRPPLGRVLALLTCTGLRPALRRLTAPGDAARQSAGCLVP